MSDSMSPTEKAALVYKARLAEQAERWDDMAKLMAERSEGGGAYTQQEALLMATAFKNVMAPLRIQWKLAAQAKAKYATRGLEHRARMADECAKQTAAQIKPLCQQVAGMMQKLQPGDGEVAALFAKMVADYTRYETEVSGGSAEATGAAYQRATAACAKLPPTSAVKLGTALNYAVFTHDIKQQPAAAVAIANDALQSLGGAEPNDRHGHMAATLLKSNIALWNAENKAVASA